MIDLSTNYMGLQLKSPVIAASSGLTKSVENVKELAEKGVGAVVLKSLFEEQINMEIGKAQVQSEHSTPYSYAEADDYISNYSREYSVNEYITLIKDCKKEVDIPIIASINCISASEWTTFARRIEEAGADALELNIFILPSDPRRSGEENQKIYLDIIQKVLKEISIPLAIKISYYFSGLAKFALSLSWTGISGMVLFNRFFSPDIDINNFKVTASNVYSSPEELAISLRWVAMLSDKLHCDIAASTGVHDGAGVIKQLLAGANVVQIASTLYKNGFDVVPEMLKELKAWMEKNKFSKIDDFKGKLSYKQTDNPAPYERVQFMKHFAGIE